MHRITLTIILLFSATAVDAAWYQKIDGTIVDPIQWSLGGDLPYSGNNLEPGSDLTGANLWLADLIGADLTGADLTSADLTGALLWQADLIGADLTGALLTGAILIDANLSGSYLSGVLDYNDAAWTDAFYYTDNEPTWDSGMDAAWRTSVGILALAPTNAVPEPSTLLLALIALAMLPRRRRR